MRAQSGFSLVELMISMLLGLMLTVGVIQVLVSTRATNTLNQAIAEVQESGRYISMRLQEELMEAGRYDTTVSSVDNSVDLLLEASFVQSQPIALPGDYNAQATVGSAEGSSTNSDEVVVNLLAGEDCTGNSFGLVSPQEMHVVNRYFVDGDQLKCIGYSGRYLRGLVGNSTPSSEVVILDNVASFQVEYGLSDDVNNNNSQVVQFVDASQLAAARLANQQVVSVRIELLLKSEPTNIQNTATNQVRLLSEAPLTLDVKHYYQVFAVSIALRNSLNYVGSAAL